MFIGCELLCADIQTYENSTNNVCKPEDAYIESFDYASNEKLLATIFQRAHSMEYVIPRLAVFFAGLTSSRRQLFLSIRLQTSYSEETAGPSKISPASSWHTQPPQVRIIFHGVQWVTALLDDEWKF